MKTEEVHVFDSAIDGLVVLTPGNIRNMSDEALIEFIAWIVSIQEDLLKPRSCPFHGSY